MHSATQLASTSSWGLSRLALIGVVIVLVVAAVILAVEIGTGPPKALPRIQIDRVSFDRVDAPAGHSFYLLELNASNAGPVPWKFNPRFLEIVSNDSHVYSTDSNYNATSLLGEFSVGEGNYKVGQVAFELPIAEAPSRLRYSDPGVGVNLDVGSIPRVSAVASRFSYNVRLTINGRAVAVNGWTVTTVNGTDQWVGSIISNGVILNNSLVFFTGQTVQVSLWFEYLRQPVDPVTITLQSVAAGNGFQIVKIDGTLPLTITGWGTTSDPLVLLLRVPAGQHSDPDLSVQFSA